MTDSPGGSDVVIGEATAPLGEAWSTMTFPLYRQLLPLVGTDRAGAAGNRPIACTATSGGAPAGLILAQIAPTTPTSVEMLSVFVLSDFRGRSVATRLVACLEAAAV